MKKGFFTLWILLNILPFLAISLSLSQGHSLNRILHFSDFTQEVANEDYCSYQETHPQEPVSLEPMIPNGPFTCNSEFFFTVGPGELSVLDPLDLAGGLQSLFSLPTNVNATGYNPLDDYIYAIGKGASNNGHPLRIHSDGTVEDLGDIGLTLSVVVGGFDPTGLYGDGELNIYINYDPNRDENYLFPETSPG